MSRTQTLAPPDAHTLFERMRERRVLVVGDVMVDEWIWGSVSRISPEAPVPVVAVSDHSFTLGGAGNVANNLCGVVDIDAGWNAGRSAPVNTNHYVGIISGAGTSRRHEEKRRPRSLFRQKRVSCPSCFSRAFVMNRPS